MRTAWMGAAALALVIAAQANAATKRSGDFCINDATVGAPVPQKDGTIYFRGEPRRNKSYIGVFKGGGCPGMHIDSTLIIERDGAQYCEGDKVRALDPPQTIPGPVCILDHFDPAPPEAPRAPRR